MNGRLNLDSKSLWCIGKIKAICLIVTIFLLGATPLPFAQSVDDCMMCHEDPDLTKERDGREVSLSIDLAKFNASKHVDVECIGCHADLMDAELPHEENL